MTRARLTTHIDWHQYFYYDEESPSCLRWKIPNGRKKAGDAAGTLSQGYWSVGFGSTRYMCHRVIWELLKERLQEDDNIDHVSGVSSDNRISNLEPKSHANNCQNKKRQVDNTSGETGVYLNVKKGRKGKEIRYWMASWVELDGSQRTKCFNIDKLGDEEAFDLACRYRNDKLEELNAVGGRYSKSHGER